MDKMHKNAVLAGLIAAGLGSVMLIAKTARHRHPTGMYEKVGKSIDERLRESKEALDRATARVQSVFEHIKNRKP